MSCVLASDRPQSSPVVAGAEYERLNESESGFRRIGSPAVSTCSSLTSLANMAARVVWRHDASDHPPHTASQ
jgi:hypothetical protein